MLAALSHLGRDRVGRDVSARLHFLFVPLPSPSCLNWRAVLAKLATGGDGPRGCTRRATPDAPSRAVAEDFARVVARKYDSGAEWDRLQRVLNPESPLVSPFH